MNKEDDVYSKASKLYREFTENISVASSFLEDDLLDQEKRAITLHVNNPRLIFDLGTGNGRALPFLASRYNCRIVAIDYEQGMLDLAKQKSKGFNIEFMKGDFIKILPKLEDPDVIFCLGTVYCALQNDDHRNKFLKEVFNKLKQRNGLLFLGYRTLDDAVEVENVLDKIDFEEGAIIFFEEERGGVRQVGSQFYPTESKLKAKLTGSGFFEIDHYRIEAGRQVRDLSILGVGDYDR